MLLALLPLDMNDFIDTYAVNLSKIVLGSIWRSLRQHFQANVESKIRLILNLIQDVLQDVFNVSFVLILFHISIQQDDGVENN